MNFLDLAPSDQAVAAGPQPGEAARLPATFGEAFGATWNEAKLFGNANARGMAQHQALEDYVAETRKRTGVDLSDAASHIIINSDWSKANEQIAKLNAANPDLRLDPLTPEEIDRRAVQISRQARQDYGEVSAREKTTGGGFGQFLGGLAGAAADPFNLVAGVVTGGEGGVLLTALRFGGAAAAAQAANEVVQAPFRETVQPGYGASGAPLANILEAGESGAALGGGLKALGNVWTRVKTGAWPTSVRDAGNLIESEAHTQQSNVYQGAAGEAAHRDALVTATDQIIKGEPVDVASHVTPEVEATAADPLVAYHASPHEFDAFSLENIGTGEGAQTYGHGLYFAENPAVSGPRGEYTRGFAEQHGFANSYQVHLHADADKMLDWFKPLSEQSPHVQRVLRDLMERSPEKEWFASRGDKLTGEEIYDALARANGDLNDQQLASSTLREAGIPGIKYLDRGSRPKDENFTMQRVGDQFYVHDQFGGAKGPFATLEGARAQAKQSATPTRNFVMFSDKDITITHKNGEPVARAMTSLEGIRTRAAAAAEAAQAARAGEPGPAPELPFEATAAEAQAATAMDELRSRVAEIAQSGGHTLSPAEVSAIADRLAKASPEDAANALRDVKVSPRQLAAQPLRPPKVAEPEPLTARSPEEAAQMLASPDHEAALRSDIDRARATGDVKIPAGVDPEGNRVFRSLDSALDEVDGFKKAADEIQACAAPVQEAAE